MGKWTIREIEFLRANFERMTVRDMAEELQRKRVNVVYALNYYVSKDWRLTRFVAPKKKKTRKKQPKPPKSRTTCFSIGHVPANTVDIGTITIRKNNGAPAKYIKLSFRGWMPYSRYVWEQANGPIPPGHIVTFIDGNPMNCELSNLEIITRAEHATRNYNPAKVSKRMKANWEKVRKFESLGIQPHGLKLKTKRKPIEATVPARVDAEQLRLRKDYFN